MNGRRLARSLTVCAAVAGVRRARTRAARATPRRGGERDRGLSRAADRGRSRGASPRASRARRRSTIRSRARVRGDGALDRSSPSATRGSRRARRGSSPGPITRAAGRTVVEAVLRLHHEGRDVDLPIAVVGDDAPDGRLRALRVYHSFWPLEGHHRVRPPLLRRDPAALTRAPSPNTSARSPPATSTQSSRPSRRTAISASRQASPGSTAAPPSCASS